MDLTFLDALRAAEIDNSDDARAIQDAYLGPSLQLDTLVPTARYSSTLFSSLSLASAFSHHHLPLACPAKS